MVNISVTAEDGQHRHGGEWMNLEIGDDALMLLAQHLRDSDCIPKPIDPEANLPVQFVTDKNVKKATVICGICKKELGKCDVKVKAKK